MTDWRNYLADKEPTFSKRKRRSATECKRNKINKKRFGSCKFNENDECCFCHRPRRKVLRLDATTNTVIVEYLE